VSENVLNEVVTAEDRERLLEYLRSAGALDESRRYRGSSTRGPDESSAPDAPARYTPLSLSDLLGSRMGYYLDAGYPYQPTMVQVVGGTDRLPQAFAARLKDRVVYRANARLPSVWRSRSSRAGAPPAICHRVRDRVFSLVPSRHLESRLMVVGLRRDPKTVELRMEKSMKPIAAALFVLVPAAAFAQQPPVQVTFYGAPTAAISSGVVIPANKAFVWTSGTTPAVADANAKPGTRERFGDTRTASPRWSMPIG
jgi:hypothetical protein